MRLIGFLMAFPLALSVIGFLLAFTGVAPGAINMGLGCLLGSLVGGGVALALQPPRDRTEYKLPNQMPPRLHPRDERDPFCTCPKCGLLGNHPVEVTAFHRERPPGRQHLIETTNLGDPPEGTLRAKRVCIFCEHVWHTEAEQPEPVDTPKAPVEISAPSGPTCPTCGQESTVTERHSWPPGRPSGREATRYGCQAKHWWWVPDDLTPAPKKPAPWPGAPWPSRPDDLPEELGQIWDLMKRIADTDNPRHADMEAFRTLGKIFDAKVAEQRAKEAVDTSCTPCGVTDEDILANVITNEPPRGRVPNPDGTCPSCGAQGSWSGDNTHYAAPRGHEFAPLHRDRSGWPPKLICPTSRRGRPPLI